MPPPCAGKVQQQALEGESPTWVTALTDFRGLAAAPGGSLMSPSHGQHDSRDLVQLVGGWCVCSSVPSGRGACRDRRPQPRMPGVSPPGSVPPGGCLEEVSSGELQEVAAGGMEGTLKAGPLVYRVGGGPRIESRVRTDPRTCPPASRTLRGRLPSQHSGHSSRAAPSLRPLGSPCTQTWLPDHCLQVHLCRCVPVRSRRSPEARLPPRLPWPLPCRPCTQI